MKYILIASLLLNSGLLMAVLGPWPFFLYLSLILNGALIWYIKNLLEEIGRINQDTDEVFESLSELNTHLESVYELEMFYGEPVLEALIKHLKDVIDDIHWRSAPDEMLDEILDEEEDEYAEEIEE